MSSYWQGKGAGKRIAVRFDKPLVGDVTGNAGAFTVKGMVRNPLKYGPLTERTFDVDSVERYPLTVFWQDDFSGDMDGVEVTGAGIGLKLIGGQKNIQPVMDTRTNQTAPNTIHGTSKTLAVLGTVNYYARTYMKFNLPDIRVTKAELWMYYLSNDIPAREQRHHVKRITQDWSEDTLTYNNAPSFNGEGSLQTGSYGRLENVDGHGTGVEKWRKVDITTLVQEWQDETYPNYGLVLDHNYNQSYDGGVWASIQYCSREYEAVTLRPYLVLNMPAQMPEPGTYTLTLPTAQIPESADPRLRFDTTTPDDTSITAEYACTDDDETPPETWMSVDDEDLLTIDDAYLWLRYTLETEDTSKTPTLLAVWLEEATAPPGTILLTMTPDSRFNDAEGDLTISYEQAKGTLTGTRPVEDFTESFTPTGLEPTPINVQGTITAGIEVEVDFIEVDYIDLGHKNTITAGITVEVDLIPVSVIPP